MCDVPFLEVFVERDNRQGIIHAQGEVDFATAPLLQRAVDDATAAGTTELVLDFERVTFLDSEGMKVLLRAYLQLRAIGGSVVVRCCRPAVARVFKILGLEAVFGVTVLAACNGPRDDPQRTDSSDD